MTKYCTKCHLIKHVDDFRKRQNSSNTLRSQCKSCLSKLNCIYNKNHPEQRSLIKKNIINRSRSDARLRWATFKANLKEKIKMTKEDYIKIFINDPPCIYCNKKIRETGSQLDRIDNSKGYEVSNVNPCCGTCNKIRGNNLTVEETKIAIAAVIDFRNKIITE